MLWCRVCAHRKALSYPCVSSLVALAAALVVVSASSVSAAVPETMTFQGVLSLDGAPFTGAADLGFEIYADSAGGGALWTQAAAATEITDGLYSVELGSLSTLDFDQQYWLEVSVDGAPLSPRYPLHSVPYALRAETAEQVTPGSIDGTAVLDGSLGAADIGPDIVSSISGVVNDGGDIDLVAGANITITPDAEAKTITIAAAEDEGGDVTSVHGGAGLTATAAEGPAVTLDVSGGPGIAVTADAVQLAGEYLAGSVYDKRFVNHDEPNSVSLAMLEVDLVGSVDGVSGAGGDIDLIGGANITIKPDAPARTITISAADGAGGDVTDVFAGPGLTATDPDGPQVSLSVGAGAGITVTEDEVAVDAGDGLTASKGALAVDAGTGLAFDGGRLVLAGPYATGSAYDERFMQSGVENSVTLAMFAPAVLSSLNGVYSNGDNIDLIAGNNISISADDINNTIRITAADCEGGDVTDVLGGAGLLVTNSGGPQPMLDVQTGNGIHVRDDTVELTAEYIDGSVHDERFVNENQEESITTPMVVPDIVSSLDGVHNDGGDIDLVAGTNVTITPDDETNTITFSALGDVTDVHGGAGLTATNSGGPEVTLAVNTGTGLEISSDAVRLTAAYSGGSAHDSRFVNEEGPGTIPIGGVIMWSGSIGSIPSGWALCNGGTVNGHTTPNLLNRFVLGAGSSYSVGSTGGETSHTLTINEMPTHSHGVSDPGHTHCRIPEWEYGHDDVRDHRHHDQ